MRRGLTPLGLPLLGLGVLVLAGFFAVATPQRVYAAQNITSQQLDTWIAEAVKNSTPPTGAFSQEVINEANTGKYKFPVPSYAQIGIVCQKVNSAEAGGSTLLGVQVTDATAKNACDTWQTDTGNLNHIIGNYYVKVLFLKTATAEQRSATRACVDPDNSFGGSGCIPTDAQIQKLINAVNADKDALYKAATLSNIQAAGASAAQMLKDSGCPDQSVVATGATTDTPSPDFVAQYKKDHPNDPVPTCQQLRDSAAQAALAQKNAEAAANTSAGDSCGITDITACLVSGMAWIISEIEWLILGVAAGILGLANYLLGWSTYVTVFQFGNLVGNSAGLLAAWGVMRDVANIVLLFGFIFLGVSTILNLPHSEYTAKKAIPSLIIFALLLNFSLFAVEAVIDVSNALATSIYEQATGGQGVCEQDTSTVDCIFKQGIGGQVMSMSGMANMYGFGSGENEAAKGGNVQLVVVYAGLIIFAVITTLVLFAAAIMLIIRAVVLAFLMVTAPIGFAGMAIPPLHEMASRWWKELISQAIFAPVYFLLALLSLKIMSGVMIALGTSSTGPTRETLAGVFTAASDTGARGSNITIVMTFALIIGFMVAALMFAKKSSAMGTSMAMSGAGKMAFGSLGFVGRNTAGRASLLAANRIAKSSIGRTGIGRMAYGLANKGASSSFDFRQTGGAKTLEGAVGGLGTVRKSVQHGMHGIEEDKIKERVEYAKKIKQTDEEVAEEARLNAEKKAIESEKVKYQSTATRAGNDLQGEVSRFETEVGANARTREAQINAQKTLIEQEEKADGPNQQVVDHFKNELKKLETADAVAKDAERKGLELRRSSLKTHQKATSEALKKFDQEASRKDLQIKGGEMYEEDGTLTKYTGVNRDAALREYGKNLQSSVYARIAHLPSPTELTPGGITGHADHEAGAQVIRNAARTGTERAIADLQASLASSAPAAAPVHSSAQAGGGDAHH